MRRLALSRVTGLLFATLASLSAPGLGLAHGYAHHEATEHAHHDRDHHQESAYSTPAATDGLVTSIDGTDSSGDHGHPELALGVGSRADFGLFVLAAKVELPGEVVVESQTSLLLTAAPPRAGPPDAPPRQPRAPPLG